MHKMWIVSLTQEPQGDYWPVGYFPRKFYYKKEAQRQVELVEQKGGVAIIERES